MSNPYTQPSLTGYNSAPPADDGSEVTSNQVTWSKHKDKLGDPLKTFAQAIDANALAAFNLIFGSAVLAKVAPYTVATADRGRIITVTGTTTITLPPAATAGSGFPLGVVNIGSGTVTVDGDGTETINGDTTIDLLPQGAASRAGGGIIMTCDGSNWAGIQSGDSFDTGLGQQNNWTARQDFDSGIQIGDDATNDVARMPQILYGTASIDPPAIVGHGRDATNTITVTGAVTDDPCLVIGTSAIPTGGIVYQAYCNATDTVTVVVENTTSGSVNPTAVNVHVLVYRGITAV